MFKNSRTVGSIDQVDFLARHTNGFPPYFPVPQVGGQEHHPLALFQGLKQIFSADDRGPVFPGPPFPMAQVKQVNQIIGVILVNGPGIKDAPDPRSARIHTAHVGHDPPEVFPGQRDGDRQDEGDGQKTHQPDRQETRGTNKSPHQHAHERSVLNLAEPTGDLGGIRI